MLKNDIWPYLYINYRSLKIYKKFFFQNQLLIIKKNNVPQEQLT